MTQILNYVAADGKNWQVASSHIMAIFETSEFIPAVRTSAGFTILLTTATSLATRIATWTSGRSVYAPLAQTIDYITPEGCHWTVAVEYIVGTYEASDGTTTVLLDDGSTLQTVTSYTTAASDVGTARAAAGLP